MQAPRLVFAPLFGATFVADYSVVTHRRAWGLLVDDKLMVLHALRRDGTLSEDHTMIETRLFEAELEHVKDIEEGDPTVPDEVFVKLAEMALVREAN